MTGKPVKEQERGWIESLELPLPSLSDNRGDADRLAEALRRKIGAQGVRVDLDLLQQIPDRLREWDYRLRCILFKERAGWTLAGIVPPDSGRPAGIAVDLGTTRVVLRLIDLATGEILAQEGMDNPQIEIGPDILTRIHYAGTEGGLADLHGRIIRGIDERIRALCGGQGIDPEEIYLMAVAGNTAMSHLFLGISPKWIIREPYIPGVNMPGLVRGRALGLDINPCARVLVFPNIGSYFGGDLIAGILYSGLHKSPETALLVDVGTNAEVVIGNENWMMACAGAAGPALEGGVTRMGMMANPGVIDRVDIDPETRNFSVRTIEDAPPVGICGSGLIDLAANLFLSGMIDIQGRFVPEKCNDRLKEIDEVRHLVVVSEDQSGTGADLYLSQIDLDSLIRSKAAMYTILETLTHTLGISFDEITRFNVAGTFGAFIRPESAIAIGMIPDLPRERFKVMGNSSLEGATRLLQSRDAVDEIYAIREGITYMELNVNQEFMNRFSAAKFLPHTDRSRFPSVNAAGI